MATLDDIKEALTTKVEQAAKSDDPAIAAAVLGQRQSGKMGEALNIAATYLSARYKEDVLEEIENMTPHEVTSEVFSAMDRVYNPPKRGPARNI